MNRDYSTALEKSLLAVDTGALVTRWPLEHISDTLTLAEHLTIHTEGKGKVDIYHVFPGIDVCFNQFLADKVHFQHNATKTMLEINHCRFGRIGWNMKEGMSIYLDTGDLSLHAMDCCADSVMTLPLGCFEGITVCLDLNVLKQQAPKILEEAKMDFDSLYETFCLRQKPMAIPSNQDITCIFSVLYDLPEHLRIAYAKLKVQELILYLSRVHPNQEKKLNQYSAAQVEIIKEIHQLLTLQLSKRYTIEELAKQYLINTSSLKTVFKAVYGLPIATYMKEYRIREAMKLLRSTNESIAHIAAEVGYETQGKFTSAFKSVTHTLPTEYRKQYGQ